MNLFDVYPLYAVEPVRAEGCYLWDAQGQQYLDLYGGHAVISIGHSHPHYVARVSEQLGRLGFYSNAVQNSLQTELAEKLGRLSGYEDYALFLVNSGAEAIENALKLASFHTRRKKVVYLERAFHGRTSAAVAVTDNPKIIAPVNIDDHTTRLAFNDLAQLEALLETETYCAVIIEGIQGVGGIYVPAPKFLEGVRKLCDDTGTVLILDEIQSGYGRSGKFFAHQHGDVKPDIITVAKGMGNGFPIGGVLIGPRFDAWHGMLGTTFGGNHLACAAAIAVLDVLEEEQLIPHAATLGDWLMGELKKFPAVKEVRGQGLMIGIELDQPTAALRKALLMQHHIFTGSASQPNVIRLLPPLNIDEAALAHFLEALGQVLQPAAVK
ncbi:MAG: aminotransferase class III-fold pyridoxal phosphate-dependent enzyme [Bacteroidia bacterium]